MIQTKLHSIWQTIYRNPLYKSCMPVVWKLQLEEETYLQLKKALIDEIASLDESEEVLFIQMYAPEIFVYVAEWYKREYNGGDGNALREIGIMRFNGARLVWDNVDAAWSRFIIKNENTSYLYSIYVLGGFPVNYENYDYFRFLRKIRQGEIDSLDSTQYAKTGFAQLSMQDNGSYAQLINFYQVHKRWPFQESDLQKPQYREFGLRTSPDEALAKYILSWEVYLPADRTSSDIRLKVGMDKEIGMEIEDSYLFLTYSRLLHWGLPNTIDNIPALDIYISVNGGERMKLFHYSNQFAKDRFVCWGEKSYKYLHCDALSKNIDDIAFYCGVPSLGEIYDLPEVYTMRNKSKVKDDETFGLRFLYPNGDKDGVWTDEKKNGTKAGVLFSNKWVLEDKEADTVTFSEDGDLFSWYEFDGNISLRNVETDDVVDFTRKGESIELRPQLLSDTIQYTDGKLLMVSNEMQEWVMTVFGSLFEVWKTDGDEVELLKPTDYTLQYRMNDCGQWTEFDASTAPQGLMTLRAKYKATGATTQSRVMFVRVNEELKGNLAKPIRRIIADQHRILFNPGIENLKGDQDYVIDMNGYAYMHSPTRTFAITVDDSELLLPVYMPLNRDVLEMKKQGTAPNQILLTRMSNEPLFVAPLISRKYLVVKRLDANGYTLIKDSNYTNRDFWLQCSDRELGAFVQPQDGTMLYTMWSGSKNDTAHSFEVNKQFADQYVFYYYDWSTNKGATIIPAEKSDMKGGNRTIIALKEVPTGRGMCFQSLKGNLMPPMYRRHTIFAQKEGKYTFDEAVRCFAVAKEHKVYFSMFPPLMSLFYNTLEGADENRPDKQLIVFFNKYIELKNGQLASGDYEALYRLSEEFTFDWAFVPRYFWHKALDTQHRHIADELFKRCFRYNPALKGKSYSERKAYHMFVNDMWVPFKRWSHWEYRAGAGKNTLLAIMPYMCSAEAKITFTGNVKEPITKRNARLKKFFDTLYCGNKSYEFIQSYIKDTLL